MSDLDPVEAAGLDRLAVAVQAAARSAGEHEEEPVLRRPVTSGVRVRRLDPEEREPGALVRLSRVEELRSIPPAPSPEYESAWRRQLRRRHEREATEQEAAA